MPGNELTDAAHDVDLRPFLRKVGAGEKRSVHLSVEESREAARRMLSGRADTAQTGALLIGLRIRGETARELAGFTLGIRDLIPAESIRKLRSSLSGAPVVECAGAYDGRIKSAPVGVAAAMVAARAGVHSVFHGAAGLGRSGLGVGDITRAFGPVDGVTYIDQADYCPALHALKSIRNTLGLRTVFNTAEKLVGLALQTEGPVAEGPAAAGEVRSLVAGVFHGTYLEIAAEAALVVGIRRALIIQGLEGSDDIPVTRNTRVIELIAGNLTSWPVKLEDLGIECWSAASMGSQGLDSAMTLLQAALAGEPGPVAEAIALNAGMRLYLAEQAPDLREGVVRARELMKS